MKLFEPLKIKKMKLKNRLVMAPMQLVLGLTNKRARAYYMERAKGGVGSIILAATAVDLLVDDKAWGRPDGIARFTETMQSFTDEVRKTGAKIGIQLWHGNYLPAGNGAANLPGSKRVAPTANGETKELTKGEIQSIIEKFALASKKAMESGLDFVDLHGAHGYLLCQFFSGADNKRTDEYGGDLYARMRFGLETVKSVRDAVGNDFPVFYRLGAEEKRASGVTLRHSKLFAVELEKAGVDVMDVSIGHVANRSASPSKRAKMGTFVYLAEAIKQNIKIPVIAVGRIHTADMAETILTQQKADLIALGRQLITDPYWPQKVLEGRLKEIIP
ncbi:MAG: NADH:flavin oxidoreductase, partial [Desulfobacterales bacterium]|nr:NADH:flavin oxidoreductase [Desulfobacterales bacterium]